MFEGGRWRGYQEATLLLRGDLSASISQNWPPFVLVAGLLMIGVVVERDGVFEAAGAWVERRGGSAAAMLPGCW
jgi:Na+/H+ antiporter NhaD/arsenite permease-like protein